MRYHFEFCIEHGNSSVDLNIPTAPMFLDAKTYSGRCKMWLKRVDTPTGMGRTLDDNIGKYNFFVEFNTPATNRYYLTTTTAALLAANPSLQMDCGSSAKFVIPINNETHIVNWLHQRFRGTDWDTATSTLTSYDTIAGDFDAGDQIERSVSYQNNLMDDRDCLIIGAPWGSRLTATMKSGTLQTNHADDNVGVQSNGVTRFEIVIEPLKNEADDNTLLN